MYSTVTLEPYLKANGYERIAVNQEWNALKGDIMMMSWGLSMADSYEVGGHVGVMKNTRIFISVDYYLNVNRSSYFEVWRLKKDIGSNKPTPSTPNKRRYG